MKKKLLSAVLCTAMAATLLAGCGSTATTDTTTTAADTTAAEDTAEEAADDTAEAADDTAAADDVITVGFAQVGHESDWRTASTNSCQEVFSAENGYDLQFVDCDQDSAAQIEAVRTFIQQEVDYIIIDPIVSTGWDTVLTEAEDAGIPVIVIDRTIDDSDKYVSWVGSNFKTEGLAAGEWLKAYADANSISEINYVTISGTTGASAQIGRTEGFDEVAEKYGFNKVDEQTGDFTQDGGQQVMESYIKSYEGQFNVVVCQNDNEAFGALDALDTAGISYGVDGDVIVISFDSCTAGLERVITGDITADFECNPLAAPFVADVINQLQNGETPDKEVYMEEHWYCYDDSQVSTITVDGAEQSMTKVTQDIIDAQY